MANTNEIECFIFLLSQTFFHVLKVTVIQLLYVIIFLFMSNLISFDIGSFKMCSGFILQHRVTYFSHILGLKWQKREYLNLQFFLILWSNNNRFSQLSGHSCYSMTSADRSDSALSRSFLPAAFLYCSVNRHFSPLLPSFTIALSDLSPLPPLSPSAALPEKGSS